MSAQRAALGAMFDLVQQMSRQLLLFSRYSCANQRLLVDHLSARSVSGTHRLELHFLTAELREVCEKRSAATTAFGYAAARELADRLADVDAVDNVNELSQLLGQAVSDRSSMEKSLRLEAGYSIVFGSAHPEDLKVPMQMTDWAKTSRIMILAIEANNG